jgi:Zn ribbon nucleic-acid-binding protein
MTPLIAERNERAAIIVAAAVIAAERLTGILEADIFSGDRHRPFVNARHVAICAAVELLGRRWFRIGAEMQMDHTSIIHCWHLMQSRPEDHPLRVQVREAAAVIATILDDVAFKADWRRYADREHQAAADRARDAIIAKIERAKYREAAKLGRRLLAAENRMAKATQRAIKAGVRKKSRHRQWSTEDGVDVIEVTKRGYVQSDGACIVFPE